MQDITLELLGTNRSRIAPLPSIIIEPSLTSKYRECLALVGRFNRPLLVADSNTYPISGMAISSELGLGTDDVCIPEHEVHADINSATAIATASRGHDIIIAIGSGTINDLCKYASLISSVPSVVFPTAPSMNGYVSATSSLMKDGLKTSHTSTLPLGVFCDLGILANAPYRLIRSGIGDMLCRSTAQADWLLSHLLLDTVYDPAPFDLLRPLEDEVIKMADLFPARDARAILALIKSLLVGGFGMTMCGGSYPASQGEHIIAHALEKLYPEKMRHTFHGEQIAVTTMYMEQLQRSILQQDAPPISKMSDGDIIKRLNHRWSGIRQEIFTILPAQGVLQDALRKAGAPCMPENINVSEVEFSKAVALAPSLRERFGFLNLS